MDKTGKLLVLMMVIIIGVIAVSATYLVMFNETSLPTVGIVSSGTGGDITQNSLIASNVPQSELVTETILAAKNGTPVVQFGNGEGPVTTIIAGVHGDQIPPQIAALQLINYLEDKDIKGTVYIIPFTIPASSAAGQKYFNGQNPNKVADVSGTPTNDIVNFAISKNSTVVGDFHSTKPGGDPGHDVIMCSISPTPNSQVLAQKMNALANNDIETHTYAGSDYKGAVEDVLNLNGIPSVTGLSTSSHGQIAAGSVETSFKQMLAMLKVNGNLN